MTNWLGFLKVMPALLDVKTTDYSDAIDAVIDNFLEMNEKQLKLNNIDSFTLR